MITNTAAITTKNFILENATLSVRPGNKHDPAIVSRQIHDPDLYVFVGISEASGYKLPAALAEKLNLSADEIIKIAEKNTIETANIVPMHEILGMPGDADAMPVYVCMPAAAAFLMVDDFAKGKGWSGAWIIPSSIHETLIVPDDMERCALDSIIRDINASIVDECDRLSDHAYHCTF